MRKQIGPTKYPRESILDARNTHEKKFSTHEKKFRTHEISTKAQSHDGTRPTGPTMPRNPLNLAHSLLYNDIVIVNRLSIVFMSSVILIQYS